MRTKLIAATALLVIASTGLAPAQVFTHPAAGMNPAGSGAAKKVSLGGVVTATGQIVGGSGFTVSHDGTGKYTISVPSGFKTCPVILVTPAGDNGDEPIANDFNYTTCGNGAVKMQVQIYGRMSGALMDNSFHFLVIEP
jgi:hypothetical protein